MSRLKLLIACLVFLFGVISGNWWELGGRAEVMSRLAAWSVRPANPNRSPVPAKMGARKRAYFDRLERAAAKVKAAGPVGTP